MAIFGVFANASIVVNSVDLSNRCKSLTINYNAAMLDASAMGNTTKVNLAGIKDWSIVAEFLEEFGAGLVDATLFALVGAAAFTVVVKPDSGAVSVTNPSYTGSAVLAGSPVGGSHGGLLTKSVTFNSAGALARATT